MKRTYRWCSCRWCQKRKFVWLPKTSVSYKAAISQLYDRSPMDSLFLTWIPFDSLKLQKSCRTCWKAVCFSFPMMFVAFVKLSYDNLLSLLCFQNSQNCVGKSSPRSTSSWIIFERIELQENNAHFEITLSNVISFESHFRDFNPHTVVVVGNSNS